MARDQALLDEAAGWAVRIGDPAFDDWEEFTAWLERDPAHARAYDEVVLAVGEAAEAAPPVRLAGNDDEPARPARRRWIGGVLSVALIGVAAWGGWQLRGDSYAVETGPGETRLIALEGGGEIALAGGSRIVLDRNDPRAASLEQGQALFTIAHDPAAPFTLAVGRDTLVDIGTVFDIARTDATLRVAVSEGAVVLNPGGENAHVSPGEVLSKDIATGRLTIGEVALDQVGEWREGRLTFQDATLIEVAAELSRSTGIAFVASSRAGNQQVSGSIALDGVRSDPRTLGDLLGIAVRHNGAAWEIGAR
ncbi:MAG TPA: FecR domain-containing protein [Croceibacterium sp.]